MRPCRMKRPTAVHTALQDHCCERMQKVVKPHDGVDAGSGQQLLMHTSEALPVSSVRNTCGMRLKNMENME